MASAKGGMSRLSVTRKTAPTVSLMVGDILSTKNKNGPTTLLSSGLFQGLLVIPVLKWILAFLGLADGRPLLLLVGEELCHILRLAKERGSSG